MGKMRVLIGVAIVGIVALGIGTVAAAHGNNQRFDERLTGYEEVPALSTPGNGSFRVFVDKSAQEIQWRLRFGDLETNTTQAHIHFENVTNSGPIVAFLCTNLGNGPAGTQACPVAGGTITGTIRPADIVNDAAPNGIAAGEFNEVVDAMRAGRIYVNVHSTGHPAGEIRAQLEDGHRSHD